MTSNENGKVNPGIETGGPILTAALATPACKVPPKKDIPEFTSVPGFNPMLENVAIEVSRNPNLSLPNCPNPILAITYSQTDLKNFLTLSIKLTICVMKSGFNTSSSPDDIDAGPASECPSKNPATTQ